MHPLCSCCCPTTSLGEERAFARDTTTVRLLIKNQARDSEQDEAAVAAGVREENKWEGFSHQEKAPGPLGDETDET